MPTTNYAQNVGALLQARHEIMPFVTLLNISRGHQRKGTAILAMGMEQNRLGHRYVLASVGYVCAGSQISTLYLWMKCKLRK
mmetsp:Transcript_20026/g.34464  ORF Transcript_20026/g.34464 Transcript_20026/m.34464 type:complete len:82 (-) Transcript_20026:2024-2269(-)